MEHISCKLRFPSESEANCLTSRHSDTLPYVVAANIWFNLTHYVDVGEICEYAAGCDLLLSVIIFVIRLIFVECLPMLQHFLVMLSFHSADLGLITSATN